MKKIIVIVMFALIAFAVFAQEIETSYDEIRDITWYSIEYETDNFIDSYIGQRDDKVWMIFRIRYLSTAKTVRDRIYVESYYLNIDGARYHISLELAELTIMKKDTNYTIPYNDFDMGRQFETGYYREDLIVLVAYDIIKEIIDGIISSGKTLIRYVGDNEEFLDREIPQIEKVGLQNVKDKYNKLKGEW